MIVVGVTAMCGCVAQAPSPTTNASVPTTSVSPSPEPTTSDSTQAVATGSPAAVQSYLALAGKDLPQTTKAARVALAHTVCSNIQHGSRHDAVGELAGRVGSQTTADELVTAAVTAYCPGLAGTR